MAWEKEDTPSYVHLRWNDAQWSPNAKTDLQSLLGAHPEANVLVNVLAVNDLDDVGELEIMASEHRESGQSCIFIVSKHLLGKFNDEAPVVPTWQEAMDFLEMEEIERQLGF